MCGIGCNDRHGTSSRGDPVGPSGLDARRVPRRCSSRRSTNLVDAERGGCSKWILQKTARRPVSSRNSIDRRAACGDRFHIKRDQRPLTWRRCILRGECAGSNDSGIEISGCPLRDLDRPVRGQVQADDIVRRAAANGATDVNRRSACSRADCGRA